MKIKSHKDSNCSFCDSHYPSNWIKQVNGEHTRTLEEVAYYAGPNKETVIRAVNAHEALLEAAIRAISNIRTGTVDNSLLNELRDAVALAKGKGE